MANPNRKITGHYADRGMEPPQMALTFQPALTARQRLDLAIEAGKLVNQSLDLRDFCRIVTSIEQAHRTALTRWKNDFTTKFLRAVKAAMRVPGKEVQELYLPLLSVSNFTAFVTLYDRWMQQLQDPELKKPSPLHCKFFNAFFDFVNDYDFKIAANQADVTAELESLMNERWWESKLAFAHGALELIRTGVKLSDLVSYIQNAYKIDPNEAVRASPSVQRLEQAPPPAQAPRDP